MTAKGRVPGGIGDNGLNKHRKALDRNTAARSDATQPVPKGCGVMIDEDFFAYCSIHNNCNVPHNVPHLGEWVNNQRRFKKMYDAAGKNSSLAIKRIEKLNTLGFDWNLQISLSLID